MGVRATLLLGLCFTACLGPALSFECYVPGTGGVFAYDPTADSPDTACLSYHYDCSTLLSLGQECKAADNGKWVYTTTTVDQCAVIKTQASGTVPAVYKHAKCCTTDKCNAPDPTLDPVTKVVPKPAGLAG